MHLDSINAADLRTGDSDDHSIYLLFILLILDCLHGVNTEVPDSIHSSFSHHTVSLIQVNEVATKCG